LIPPSQVFAETVRTLEAELDTLGWDQAPVLYAIDGYAATGADSTRYFEALVARPVEVVNIALRHGGVGDLLHNFVTNLVAAPPDLTAPLLEQVGSQHLAGFVLFVEAWTNNMTPEVTQRFASGATAGAGRKLADFVGSAEVRYALGFDVAGRQYQQMRIRKPPGRLSASRVFVIEPVDRRKPTDQSRARDIEPGDLHELEALQHEFGWGCGGYVGGRLSGAVAKLTIRCAAELPDGERDLPPYVPGDLQAIERTLIELGFPT
jgi:hypothetical protein